MVEVGVTATNDVLGLVIRLLPVDVGDVWADEEGLDTETTLSVGNVEDVSSVIDVLGMVPLAVAGLTAGEDRELVRLAMLLSSLVEIDEVGVTLPTMAVGVGD